VGSEKDQYSLVPIEGIAVMIQGSKAWLPRLVQGETFPHCSCCEDGATF
jgi:hypothetical protein